MIRVVSTAGDADVGIWITRGRLGVRRSQQSAQPRPPRPGAAARAGLSLVHHQARPAPDPAGRLVRVAGSAARRGALSVVRPLWAVPHRRARAEAGLGPVRLLHRRALSSVRYQGPREVRRDPPAGVQRAVSLPPLSRLALGAPAAVTCSSPTRVSSTPSSSLIGVQLPALSTSPAAIGSGSSACAGRPRRRSRDRPRRPPRAARRDR